MKSAQQKKQESLSPSGESSVGNALKGRLRMLGMKTAGFKMVQG